MHRPEWRKQLAKPWSNQEPIYLPPAPRVGGRKQAGVQGWGGGGGGGGRGGNIWRLKLKSVRDKNSMHISIFQPGTGQQVWARTYVYVGSRVWAYYCFKFTAFFVCLFVLFCLFVIVFLGFAVVVFSFLFFFSLSLSSSFPSLFLSTLIRFLVVMSPSQHPTPFTDRLKKRADQKGRCCGISGLTNQ